MRRFFTLLSLLCVVATTLIVSDLYRAQYSSDNLSVNPRILLRDNPYYSGIVGVEVFPIQKPQIIN